MSRREEEQPQEVEFYCVEPLVEMSQWRTRVQVSYDVCKAMEIKTAADLHETVDFMLEHPKRLEIRRLSVWDSWEQLREVLGPERPTWSS